MALVGDCRGQDSPILYPASRNHTLSGFHVSENSHVVLSAPTIIPLLLQYAV